MSLLASALNIARYLSHDKNQKSIVIVVCAIVQPNIQSSVHADTIGGIGRIGTAVADYNSGFHGMVDVAADTLPEYSGAEDNHVKALPLVIFQNRQEYHCLVSINH